MKKFIFALAIFSLFSFVEEAAEVVFKSIDGKTTITATDQWTAAGNMKGVEIYISRENKVNNVPAVVVVAKDENMSEDMDLATYSASKLFLQTAVLKTAPSLTGNKTINGTKFKYYEYEYSNKDLIKMKTLVYHALIGTNGYQMTVTTAFDGFEQNQPLYNQIANSLALTK